MGVRLPLVLVAGLVGTGGTESDRERSVSNMNGGSMLQYAYLKSPLCLVRRLRDV
jgi:hypothetical protein